MGMGRLSLLTRYLGTILTKLVSGNIINWDEHLSLMLFSNIITYKVVTRYTPYQLMYGLHPLMPTKYIVPIAGGNERNNILMKVLINKITKLEKL
jgi:hypothetical protein